MLKNTKQKKKPNKSKLLLSQLGSILACNTQKSDGRVIMDRMIIELKKTNRMMELLGNF